MPIDLLLGGVAAVICLAGAGILLVLRRRRQERLELRLLAGRERLLGDEIEACLAALEEQDGERVATARAAAETALDGLHTKSMERQAHLLNYEDLVHLQQCKIEALQAARLAPPAAPKPVEIGESARRGVEPAAPRRATEPRPQSRGTRPPAPAVEPEPPVAAPRSRPPSPRPEPPPPPKERTQLEEELRQRISKLQRGEDGDPPPGKPTKRR